MKKVILLALCLALAGMLAVNGTFAAEFTQAVGEAVSRLFKNVEELLESAPTTEPNDFKVSLCYLDSNSDQPPQLLPGGTVNRQIAVANGENSSDAYFRIAIAVQTDAWKHMTEPNLSGAGYKWLTDWRNITIGDRDYLLMIGTYTEGLDAGETSPAVLLSVKLSEDVTSEQMNGFDDDFLQIQVLAVDADAFEDAREEIICEQGQTFAEAVLDKALPITPDFNPFE